MNLFFTQNMSTSFEHAGLPPDLPLKRAPFYSRDSSVVNISTGMRGRSEYVAFDNDSQNGDMSHTETVVAIKTASPAIPDTNLSRSAGLQLERVGEWICAFELRRVISRSKIAEVVDDIVNLLDYAKDFPQNA
jgi:hypothetical protein